MNFHALLNRGLCFLFAFSILGPFSMASAFSTSHQQVRFEKWLDILETPLASGKNGAEAAEALIAAADSRVASFNLQGLAKIYESLDKDGEFVRINADFKGLEDAIGAVDKWQTLEKKDELKKAMKDLADLLEDKNWSKNHSSPRIGKIRKFITDFKWSNVKKDQEFFAEQIRDDLKKLEKTNFEFETLEEGNGLHEFRRSARWFLMKARVLNGGIQFKQPENKCASKANADLLQDEDVNTSKYAVLPEDVTGQYTCRISKCLYLSVVQVVEQIGVIKDEIEKIHGNDKDDSVPKKQKKQAEDVYENFLDRESLPALIKEMDACR